MTITDEHKEMAEQAEVELNNGASQPGTDVKDQTFEFSGLRKSSLSKPSGNIDMILDIPLKITAELGRTEMIINDLLKLGQGSVIELSQSAGDTLGILANQRLIAKGEVVVINEKYGVRITEIISPIERIEGLK